MGGVGLIFTPVLVRRLSRPSSRVWAYMASTSWTHSYSKQSSWAVIVGFITYHTLWQPASSN